MGTVSKFLVLQELGNHGKRKVGLVGWHQMSRTLYGDKLEAGATAVVVDYVACTLQAITRHVLCLPRPPILLHRETKLSRPFLRPPAHVHAGAKHGRKETNSTSTCAETLAACHASPLAGVGMLLCGTPTGCTATVTTQVRTHQVKPQIKMTIYNKNLTCQ